MFPVQFLLSQTERFKSYSVRWIERIFVLKFASSWLNIFFWFIFVFLAFIAECLSKLRLSCSHHCVVTDKGIATCRCPQNQALRSDNSTCYPLGEFFSHSPFLRFFFYRFVSSLLSCTLFVMPTSINENEAYLETEANEIVKRTAHRLKTAAKGKL